MSAPSELAIATLTAVGMTLADDVNDESTMKAAEVIDRAFAQIRAEERAACEKIADDYRKSATDSGVPQIILLGGAAQIIRNAIRARGDS